MDPKMKALGFLVGLLLLVVLFGVNFLFRRFRPSELSAGSEQLEGRIRDLMEDLGLEVSCNYFVCTSPLSPTLNNLIRNINWQVFANRQVLVMVTAEGLWLRYLGNAITAHRHGLKDDLREKVIYISKSDIHQFRLENWRQDFRLQCLLTLKTKDRSYFFVMDDERGAEEDFSSVNFQALRDNEFFGLLREDETRADVFRRKEEK